MENTGSAVLKDGAKFVGAFLVGVAATVFVRIPGKPNAHSTLKRTPIPRLSERAFHGCPNGADVAIRPTRANSVARGRALFILDNGDRVELCAHSIVS